MRAQTPVSRRPGRARVRLAAVTAGIARLWREGTAAVLALYLVLAALANILDHVGTSSGTIWRAQAWSGFAVAAFLTWRVWRGGYVSWVVLWLVNGVIAGLGGLFALTNGSGGSAAVFALGVIGLMLLASPAARSRL